MSDSNAGNPVKVILTTIVVWVLCVVGIAYWYVVIGSGWVPVSAEYEQWKDYRFGFFLLGLLPPLVVLLLAILWAEWWVLHRRDRRS